MMHLRTLVMMGLVMTSDTIVMPLQPILTMVSSWPTSPSSLTRRPHMPACNSLMSLMSAQGYANATAHACLVLPLRRIRQPDNNALQPSPVLPGVPDSAQNR